MIKDLEKHKFKIIIIAIIVIALVIIKIIDTKMVSKQNTTGLNLISYSSDTEDENSTIKIYITGEVNIPGVIELNEGDRISDAIEKAGGLTENANLKNVNLAYQLMDGEKIYIPNNEEANVESELIDDGIGKNNLININKATAKELQDLNGIGESLAISIIEYREKNGKFSKAEDLLNVPGIGEAKFSKIKEQIKVK